MLKFERLLSGKHSYVDQSPIVARRLGFPAIPLAVLAALIGSQSAGIDLSPNLLAPRLLVASVVANVQWVVLGLIFWVWCVASLSKFRHALI